MLEDHHQRVPEPQKRAENRAEAPQDGLITHRQHTSRRSKLSKKTVSHLGRALLGLRKPTRLESPLNRTPKRSCFIMFILFSSIFSSSLHPCLWKRRAGIAGHRLLQHLDSKIDKAARKAVRLRADQGVGQHGGHDLRAKLYEPPGDPEHQIKRLVSNQFNAIFGYFWLISHRFLPGPRP